MKKRRMIWYFLIGVVLGFLTGMIAPPREWKAGEEVAYAEAEGA